MNVPFITQLCNFTKDGKPCYCARSLPGAKTGEDVIFDRASIRCGGIDPAFMKFSVRSYLGEVANELSKGNRVESEFFTGGVSVRGDFPTSDAPWDPERNRLTVYLTPRGPLKDVVKGMTAVNMTEGPRTVVRSVMQDMEGAEESVFRVLPGMQELLALIAGTGLLVDVQASDEGVDLLDPKTGEVKAVGRVTHATSTTLDCSFDPVEPGQYVLAVASRDGMGASYGVAVGRRKVTVVGAAAGE